MARNDDGLDGLGGHLPPRDMTNWRVLGLTVLGASLLACGLVAWLVGR